MWFKAWAHRLQKGDTRGQQTNPVTKAHMHHIPIPRGLNVNYVTEQSRRFVLLQLAAALSQRRWEPRWTRDRSGPLIRTGDCE